MSEQARGEGGPAQTAPGDLPAREPLPAIPFTGAAPAGRAPIAARFTGLFARLAERLRKLACTLPGWAWSDIGLPFLYTRLAWVIAALFAMGNLPPNPTYAHYAERGGFLSRIFLIDIFARWDSRWYLSIAQGGYQLSADPAQAYSNLAFFPLYPLLARGPGWLFPLPESVILLTGLALSNLLFLAACVLLRRTAVERLGLSEQSARRALLLMMAFPAGFYFSSFYPESLFLFLSLAGFWLAAGRRWPLAGLCAALAVLTRPQGVMVAAALGWLYLEQAAQLQATNSLGAADSRSLSQWLRSAITGIRADVLWLGLAPLALLGFFGWMGLRFGRFLAPVEAQAAWGRGQYGFFEGLWLNISGPSLDVWKIDALLLAGFLAAGAWMAFRSGGQGQPLWRALGVFTLLLCLMPLSTGLLVSVSRFMAVVFPVFLLLGQKLDRPGLFEGVLTVSFAMQVVYFISWVNYYWIA